MIALSLAAGPAMASSFDSRASRSESFSRSVDLEEDNVFAALAFDDNADFDEVADIDSTSSRSGSLFRSVDLDDDDVFSVLALDGDRNDFEDLLGIDEVETDDLDLDEIDDSLDADLIDEDFEIADIDRSFSATRRVTQDIGIDRDDAFLAIALDDVGTSSSLFDGDDFFDDDDIADGNSDFFDVADVRRSVTESENRRGFFDIDDNDAFLWLALD